MVFPDLSAPEVKPQTDKVIATPIASIADRFLALILDFLIFSPVVSLLIAGMVRQTKTFFLLNTASQEGIIAAGLVVAMVIFVTTLLQAVFLYYWQATPGQFFLQLRVVSYPHEQQRLSINQCILRSFMWCGGFLFLAVPFLEIASHPLRRAFHERASDTMVVTLKKVYDEGPHPLESRFISSWMRMSFLFLMLFGVLGFFKTYHSLRSGAYHEKDTGSAFACKEIKESDLSGASRLDAALSLFMLNEITSECLEKEAEASLWGDPVNSQELAYLAKFVTAEGSDQEKYFKKICENATSSTCAIARYMHEDGSKEDLEQASSDLWITRLLLSDEKYTSQDYVGSLKLIEELQKVPALKSALEKRYVRSVWALNQVATKPLKKGRVPASADSDHDSWIERFKERYEVP
ncbi:RDD family protein [Bdellovibrio bacteriovorus]|uniref:RDD family protein n=1 Tax=Bdellovibrio TaxID=958 RepID=UPI0035A8BD28